MGDGGCRAAVYKRGKANSVCYCVGFLSLLPFKRRHTHTNRHRHGELEKPFDCVTHGAVTLLSLPSPVSCIPTESNFLSSLSLSLLAFFGTVLFILYLFFFLLFWTETHTHNRVTIWSASARTTPSREAPSHWADFQPAKRPAWPISSIGPGWTCPSATRCPHSPPFSTRSASRNCTRKLFLFCQLWTFNFQLVQIIKSVPFATFLLWRRPTN